MKTPQFRVMVVINAQTREEVYGQIIQDKYMSDLGDPEASTDDVVRAYLAEMCDGCHVFNSKLDNGPLANDFTGRAFSVTEELGADEFHVVVRGLNRPEDYDQISHYLNKELDEWAPALAAYRGLDDPRKLAEAQASDLAEEQQELWNETFKHTFVCVSLAIVLLFVIRSVTGGSQSSD